MTVMVRMAGLFLYSFVIDFFRNIGIIKWFVFRRP